MAPILVAGTGTGWRLPRSCGSVALYGEHVGFSSAVNPSTLGFSPPFWLGKSMFLHLSSLQNGRGDQTTQLSQSDVLKLESGMTQQTSQTVTGNKKALASCYPPIYRVVMSRNGVGRFFVFCPVEAVWIKDHYIYIWWDIYYFVLIWQSFH